MKTVRVLEMHDHEGCLEDIFELYKWLGKIGTSSAGHNFDIEVKIV